MRVLVRSASRSTSPATSRQRRLSNRCAALLLAAALFLLLAPAAQAETLHYRYGPIHIEPGRTTIVFADNDLKPPVDGWITGFKPNLTYANGVVPRVDVVHLHHGVWISNFAPLFAAGEEKTTISAPRATAGATGRATSG